MSQQLQPICLTYVDIQMMRVDSHFSNLVYDRSVCMWCLTNEKSFTFSPRQDRKVGKVYKNNMCKFGSPQFNSNKPQKESFFANKIARFTTTQIS